MKAMIHDQDLPMYLWGEACSMAVYVQNQSPHRVLGNKTPEEVFSGKKPSVEHLRIFGCPVYIHVAKDKRSKLEPSGKKGTFVGYSETSKAYRIYVPGQRYIEVSRDVTFDEEAAFKRSGRTNVDVEFEEQEVPKEAEAVGPVSHPVADYDEELADSVEPAQPIELPREVTLVKRKLAWLRETLQEGEKHGAPEGAFRESKRPNRFSSYMALMSNIINSEPSCYDQAADH